MNVDKRYRDLLDYLVQPKGHDHSGDKTICYLTFDSDKIQQVKSSLNEGWIDIAKHKGINLMVLSLHEVLKEFFSYLKKGGVILITVPAFEFLFSSKDRVLKHFRRYRKSSLTKLVKKNFLIKKISYFNFFLFFPIAFSILYLKLKNSKFINFAESTPNYFVNLLLKKIFSAEKYFLRNINFPFGISLLLVAKKND